MGKLAYHDALDFRLKELTDAIATLKLHLEHAVGGEKFQALCEVHKLERQKRILADRLHKLESEKDGLWHDIKADIHALIDDLPGFVECWIELLDASYASLSRETRSRPTAPLEWGSEPFVRRAAGDRASHSHREHRDGKQTNEAG
jgi:hypothetical protein